ncbi:ABC transporter ATP-binding protein [Flavobacterium psychrolimnae]|uniref:ABC transporter ATP-binding protein n=1 Tax=Flavobacterium psychrolimnae TaxID=249351 RepID=A0A366B2A7_9FLAO|nr:ABC transporter ATP-binding protein [Flavobacterium psychrolimnae]RBN50318.1 ABC transporter ATP-binding protein [Flavobacterium psychrolimnae]
MKKDIILKAENISKQYRLGQVGTGTLSHDFNRWWHQIRGKENPYLKIGDANDRSTKGESDYVWALQDINFEVERGEILGIIGKNGAGKSTLLKILSRVTAPTTGSIKFGGRVASLLEVGTGFNGEMTGRENIYLNGAILGMTKKEITSKIDEIIDFSGCERYIDTPVKRYSSGMYVRLAFAVAAFLEPDILIVDEVLAVGDAEFQKKAIGKMQAISRTGGRTVLFVSHNMAAVKSLCTRGILLENGKIKDINNINTIISNYLLLNADSSAEWKRETETDSQLFFDRIYVSNSNSKITNQIASGEDFTINIFLNALNSISNSTVSIKFVNAEGIAVFTTSLHDYDNDFEVVEKGKYKLITNISKNILTPGSYNLVIACFVSRIKLFDIVEDKISINIEDLGIKKRDLDREGFVVPNYKWDFLKLE